MSNSYETRKYAYYCPKCGQCNFITYGSNELCLVCKTKMIESPPKYKLTQSDWLQFGEEFEQNKQRLFDEVISQSPEFDINLYNNKDSILKQQQKQQEETIAHGKAILEGRDKGNQFGVECPYCHATNVRKIGSSERAMSVFGLGLLSKKINKSFKCNDCGGTF